MPPPFTITICEQVWRTAAPLTWHTSEPPGAIGYSRAGDSELSYKMDERALALGCACACVCRAKQLSFGVVVFTTVGPEASHTVSV